LCASEAGSLYFYTVRPALSDALPERQKALRQISVSDRHLPEGFLSLRAFCLYSKRQFLRKNYKNIRFCYVKSLYFRYTSKIKKFRTKNPDFGTFLYGIRCFGAFYTKLTCYLFSFSFSSGWKSAKVERFVSFPNIQV